MITAGIDCGAKHTKTAILDDGKIIQLAMAVTTFDQTEAVEESLNKAVESAGISLRDIVHIAATGSGAQCIAQADVKVNDIKAMAAAAHFFFPTARTVADVGAEESRAAKLGERGEVQDFAVNERCAAGAGSFLEAMARALDTPLEELGNMALRAQKTIPMNAQCTIFAESEVVGLIHAKTDKRDISKAIHDAMAGRIASMIRRIGVHPDIVMVGGVAHNPAFVMALRQHLGVDALFVPANPEYAAAIGAALVAAREDA